MTTEANEKQCLCIVFENALSMVDLNPYFSPRCSSPAKIAEQRAVGAQQTEYSTPITDNLVN